MPADDSVGNITVSNVCARSVDLEWEAPSNYWRAVTITGYYITSREADDTLGSCVVVVVVVVFFYVFPRFVLFLVSSCLFVCVFLSVLM